MINKLRSLDLEEGIDFFIYKEDDVDEDISK